MATRVILVLFAVFLFAVTPVAFAQVTVAQLSGTVADESHGIIPGVEVTVTQTDTGFTRFVITDGQGGYVFLNLPVGPYRLTARLTGFRTFEQTGIVLGVGETRSVNVTLNLGALSEKVTVQANAASVETRKVSIANVVDEKTIEALPLAGRQVLQLMLLSGAAVAGNTSTGNRQPPNGVAIAIAGGVARGTLYLLDGGYNNDPQDNAGNAMPFPDALQEFSVESGARDARFGGSSSGTVNAITKSGANQFHGNAFIYGRNARFNSRPFFSRVENGGTGLDDGLRRAQSGGTFGGRIVRDRLFFFGGTQITNERITPVKSITIVPTAEVRRGDFRRVTSAACQGGTARKLGLPFVDNQIDPSLFNPISVKLMSMLPLPDPAFDPDGCGRYNNLLGNNSDEQQYIGRVDYQVSSRVRVFGRYFRSYFLHAPLFDQARPNLLDASDQGNKAATNSVAAGLDFIVKPSLFASTHFSYLKTSSLRLQGDGLPTWATLGVKTWTWTRGEPGQDFLGGGTAGWPANTATGAFYADTPSITQDVDWTKGAHSISFGASWLRPHSDGDGRVSGDGNFTYSGLITSGTGNTGGGLALADFVLGYPSGYSNALPQLPNVVFHQLGVYIGDVWRANRRLTINAGLRWEPYFGPKNLDGFYIAFNREKFINNVHSTVYPNAPAGVYFRGDEGFPRNGSAETKLALFSPRVGVVWDPLGDGRQTIRAGFGHFFNPPEPWHYSQWSRNAPWGNNVLAFAPTSCPGKPNKNGCPIDFYDPWSSTPGGDPQAAFGHVGQPIVLPPSNVTFPLGAMYSFLPLDITPMNTNNWNVSYQRQVAASFSIEVSYQGTSTRNMTLGRRMDPSVYIPGDCVSGQYGLTTAGPCSNATAANEQARAYLTLINPDQGKFIRQISDGWFKGTSLYNGVKLSVQKRMSRGWSLRTNYTLSKCTSLGEPGTGVGNQFPIPLTDAVWPLVPDPSSGPDPSTNSGPCDADRRHLFNASGVFSSPGIGPAFLNALTRDWQLGLIFQARSGRPLTPVTSVDNALTGVAEQRPIIVQGIDPNLKPSGRDWVQNAAGLRTQLQWFNMAAFAPNSPGLWGNTPKGYLTGPSFWQADVSFSRNIPMSNGRRVELRVEAFNIFNTVNWGDPGMTIEAADAGRVTSTTGDARIMQFAAKFAF